MCTPHLGSDLCLPRVRFRVVDSTQGVRFHAYNCWCLSGVDRGLCEHPRPLLFNVFIYAGRLRVGIGALVLWGRLLNHWPSSPVSTLMTLSDGLNPDILSKFVRYPRLEGGHPCFFCFNMEGRLIHGRSLSQSVWSHPCRPLSPPSWSQSGSSQPLIRTLDSSLMALENTSS